MDVTPCNMPKSIAQLNQSKVKGGGIVCDEYDLYDVKGRPRGSVGQLAEFSHGKREALGSSLGLATFFPLISS